jgi:type II secretory pathway component PulF
MESHFPTFRRLFNWSNQSFYLWPLHTTAAQRQSLLRLIAVATEENLPLAPLIETWALDERGVQKERLRRLARLLNSGTPLTDAVEQVRGVLRDEDVLAIRFGAQSGTLSATIRAALDESASVSTSRPNRFRKTLVYGCTVFLIGLPIVAFIQIKVMPAFDQILNEFSMEQPAVAGWSTAVASFVARFWWLGALLVIVLLSTLFSAWPGRFLRHTVFGRMFRSLRELRAAEILHKLSVATSAGRPISGALSTLARYHFDPIIRHKLLFVRNELEQGADVWQSMTAVGLLTPQEVGLLRSAERVGNRPWALKQLADGKQRRTLRRLERMSDLFLPVVVFAIAAFVLVQALAVFVPLTQFICGLL